MPTLVERLDVKLAALDSEITRVQQNATDEVARIRTQRTTLQQARAFLVANPSAEALFNGLKDMGVV